MLIKIEMKDGKYTITYGKMSAKADNVAAAIDMLVDSFRKQLLKFFDVGQNK